MDALCGDFNLVNLQIKPKIRTGMSVRHQLDLERIDRFFVTALVGWSTPILSSQTRFLFLCGSRKPAAAGLPNMSYGYEKYLKLNCPGSPENDLQSPIKDLQEKCFFSPSGLYPRVRVNFITLLSAHDPVVVRLGRKR